MSEARYGNQTVLSRVIEHAHMRRCFVKLNAQTQHLDLPDVECRQRRTKAC